MSYDNPQDAAPADPYGVRAALIRAGVLVPAADEARDDRGETLAARERVLTLDPARRREE